MRNSEWTFSAVFALIGHLHVAMISPRLGDQICPAAKAGDGEKDPEDGGWGPQWEVFVEYLDVTTIC